MARARNRILVGYNEKHHVIPRCFGGKNSEVVRLTPEEHYVAHQLLVKMYPGNRSLLWAASNMTGKTKYTRRNNKLYGWLRRKLSEDMRARMTGRKPSAETREKMRAAKLGTKQSLETIAKRSTAISAAKKGMKFSPEHRAALAAAKLGKKRGPFTEEHCAKLAESGRRAHLTRDYSPYRTQAHRELQSRNARQDWDKRRST